MPRCFRVFSGDEEGHFQNEEYADDDEEDDELDMRGPLIRYGVRVIIGSVVIPFVSPRVFDCQLSCVVLEEG